VLTVDLLVDFLPMDVDLSRGFNSKSYFVATNLNNSDLDHVVDDDAFILFPREY
jgi:hypothetical protein